MPIRGLPLSAQKQRRGGLMVWQRGGGGGSERREGKGGWGQDVK